MRIITAAILLSAGALSLAPAASASPAAKMNFSNGSAVHQVADVDVDTRRSHRGGVGVVVKDRDHDDNDRGNWRRHRHGGPRIGIVIGDGDRGYSSCRHWRHECADRFGWGGFRFQRCLDRHGC